MSTPYIGFGNDTLEQLPEVAVGQEIQCDKCGESHILEAADDGSTSLLFYECGSTPYLGAINGRLIVGVGADVSGRV